MPHYYKYVLYVYIDICLPHILFYMYVHNIYINMYIIVIMRLSNFAGKTLYKINKYIYNCIRYTLLYIV